jgi:hypothetical protein
MKSRQYCSVCKQWLDMEVVPTGDGDDDGVIWFRCPQCQGFLPKLSQPVAGGDEPSREDAGDGFRSVAVAGVATDEGDAAPPVGPSGRNAGAIPDPADDAEVDDDLSPPGGDDDADEVDDEADGADEADHLVVGWDSPAGSAAPTGEPVLEYAAMLAAVDPDSAVPYRPWETYEVGQCVLHLAWNDCGVVVAKEPLPGGRQVIKCWFQGAGVVRLIENAPR